jgi:glutamine synthetase
MDRQDVIKLIQELDVKNIKFGVIDIDGVLRGKIISTKKFLKAIQNDIGFCNVIFGWDINDECYDNSKVSGWHTGYPDSFATIDPDSYRKIPWDGNKPFFLGDFENSKELNSVCPRTLLKKILSESNELGFYPKYSAEFEWFNFSETPNSLKDKNYQSPTPITPGMFGYSVLRASQYSDYINQIFDDLYSFGIPLEGIHTETGDGVYEAAITYDDILVSADRAALFKTAVKEIASRHEIMASFMAKWNPELPGCSGHIHQSLWDEQGKNLFFDASSQSNISELMKHFIAGQLYCLPYILPIFAPSTNSYKRYVEGSWSPTSVSWGIENRTSALRVINQDQSSMRVEHRVPGADANPYLSMSAALASGLYGIKNKLSLEMEATIGNQYEKTDAEQFPKSLGDAIHKMKGSHIPAELFGEEFADHFLRTREWEWQQYQGSDDTWEMKRYFEII